MENKNLTAVEWFHDKVDDLISDELRERFELLKNEAKQTEKKQMHKCASFWRGKECEIEKPIFEQYYNETYGK